MDAYREAAKQAELGTDERPWPVVAGTLRARFRTQLPKEIADKKISELTHDERVLLARFLLGPV